MTKQNRCTYIISCLVVSFTFSACQGNSDKRYERQINSLSKNIGDTFKLNNILDSAGKTVALDFRKTDITIIDFWNNSCRPCIEEMTQFKDLLRGKEKVISVVSISVNQFWVWKPTISEHKGVFSFLSDNVVNWKHYTLATIQDAKLKNTISFDRVEELQKRYNVTFFPAYFVVDKNGIIQSRPQNAVTFINQYK